MVSFQEARSLAQDKGVYLMALFVVAFFFSTVFTTIFSILLGLLWLFTQQYRLLPNLLKKQPIACWSVLLFACVVIGTGYGNASESDTIYSLGKYKKFLYIPILMILFNDPNYRLWAWRGFVVASVITLLLSDLKAAKLLDLNPHYATATIKNRISHSIFIAFFAFYCTQKIARNSPYNSIYFVLCLLSLHNLFFVVDGRTGQAVALALVLLLAFQHLGRKSLALSLVALILVIGLFLNYSDKAKRIQEAIVNTKAYAEQTLNPALRKNSAATRYVFWEYSLQLIAEKPWLGHGTGSFVQEYNRIAKDESTAQLHAHNELIMIGVQLGLLGIIVYVGFLGSLFLAAGRLQMEDKFMAQGILLTLIITSMFNCPIYDHAQGHWAVTLIALCFAPLQDNHSRESHA